MPGSGVERLRRKHKDMAACRRHDCGILYIILYNKGYHRILYIRWMAGCLQASFGLFSAEFSPALSDERCRRVSR